MAKNAGYWNRRGKFVAGQLAEFVGGEFSVRNAANAIVKREADCHPGLMELMWE